MKRSNLFSLVLILNAFSLLTPFWRSPHWLAMIATVLVAARPTKGWDLQHYATMFGALALAGISTWLKYGGPDFQVGDTPLLGLILLVLRAIYQTPPAKAS
jgi:hypothetical protein